MINTVETRLQLDTTQENFVYSCINIWSKYYRKTWVMFNNKALKEKEIYHELMKTDLFTSHFVKSLINKVKTEHAKIRGLTKTQYTQHSNKLQNINTFITKENKLIDKKVKEIEKFKEALKENLKKQNNLKLIKNFKSLRACKIVNSKSTSVLGLKSIFKQIK